MHFQILLTVLDLSFFPLTFYTPNFTPRSTSSVNWKNHSFSAFFLFFFCRWRTASRRRRKRRRARNSTSSHRTPRRTRTSNLAREGVNGGQLAKRYPCCHCCCFCPRSLWTGSVGASEAFISFSAHILPKSITGLRMNHRGQLWGRTTPFLFHYFSWLNFTIRFLLSLPPQRVKDIRQRSCSICQVFALIKPSEQRKQIYKCMGEFRNAAWASTRSRACSTLKVHPLF